MVKGCTREHVWCVPMTDPTAMRTEIGQQPAALRATLDTLMPRGGEAAALARDCRQVLFIARGTSDNAAVYGSYLLQAHAGMLATLASPSIATEYHSRVELSGVLAVALSQSGATEEIVETLAWARDCGARTLAITNEGGSPLTQVADVAFVTAAGAELAVPATKTFTTQLAALAVLAIALGAGLDPGLLRGVPDEIERMLAGPDEVTAMVDALAGISPGGRPPAPLPRETTPGPPGPRDGRLGGSTPAARPASPGGRPPGTPRDGRLGENTPAARPASPAMGVVVSGRGHAYAAALELALKLKEACYLHAMGLSWADLLHGPVAVVDAATPAIIVAADSGPALPGSIELARRVVAAGARAYAIGGGPGLAAVSSLAVPGPRLPEWLAPLGLIVPGQLLTEALSRRLGIDPDSPRGLSKVTQTA
jgi:glucosamine--fructose-6-phosphate aminotransferase (isomerizing)